MYSAKRPMNALERFMQDYEAGTVQNPYAPGVRLFGQDVILIVEPFDDFIDLKWLASMKPREGKATAAMEWLCKLADKHQVKMKLFAVPKGRKSHGTNISKPRLKKFYARCGFKDLGWDDAMERKPR